MLITEGFVFLHLPKTGGTFVEHALKQTLRMPVLHDRRHASWREIPPEHAGKPCIGVWRDPWSWHASLYHFARIGRNHSTAAIVALASDNFSLGFGATLRRLLDPDARLLADYGKALEAFGGVIPDFECMGAQTLERSAQQGRGLMSVLAGEIFPERLDIEWEQQSLRAEFLKFIKPLAPTREGFTRTLALPNQNASPKPDLRDLYDADLARLVARKESEVIARRGYGWPAELESLKG